MNTQIFIQRLKRKWFPSADDKIWKQWVNYKQREENDLFALLTSDIRDSLKRRAIFLLLVPSAEFNPIYWTQKVGKFNHNLGFLEELNPDLLSYATDLIVEFYTMLRPMHCDKPKHYAEGGGGFTFFYSVPDKYNDALYFYNDCIVLLLTLLSEQKCEQIFPLFSIRDISTYWDLEDSSGYNPFRYLMDNNVNEKWKKQADTTIRQIIKDELSGKVKPREEWENALKCYAHIVTYQAYSEKLPYSIDLFADQIQFLFSKDHYENQLIDSWNVANILQILAGDNYKEIRYQVAEFIIFGNKKDFCITSDDALLGAEMILDEFGDKDEKLTQKIKQEIEKYKKRSVESTKKQANVKNAEDEIMNKMK